jgi:hypothetical protein
MNHSSILESWSIEFKQHAPSQLSIPKVPDGVESSACYDLREHSMRTRSLVSLLSAQNHDNHDVEIEEVKG